MNPIKTTTPEMAVEILFSSVEKHVSALKFLCSLAALALTCVLPELAFAADGGTLSANAQTAVSYIKIGVYFILIVAVLGSAVAAAFGRMEWATVGRVLIGCVVAGMASEVVDGLSGLKSSG